MSGEKLFTVSNKTEELGGLPSFLKGKRIREKSLKEEKHINFKKLHRYFV